MPFQEYLMSNKTFLFKLKYINVLYYYQLMIFYFFFLQKWRLDRRCTGALQIQVIVRWAFQLLEFSINRPKSVFIGIIRCFSSEIHGRLNKYMFFNKIALIQSKRYVFRPKFRYLKLDSKSKYQFFKIPRILLEKHLMILLKKDLSRFIENWQSPFTFDTVTQSFIFSNVSTKIGVLISENLFL